MPEDVKLSYEFDQSVSVINAVESLISEGAIGAILTGLMVLLFLGDKRAAINRYPDDSNFNYCGCIVPEIIWTDY